MVFAQYTYVLLGLACCVSADSWDDFTNNLATDLAPLISLFGEQITTQCMSELISTLDDYIFALLPLGILTAVVSMIRVCGNSTLRAFIGRAQEDPGSSEVELLSCVSDTAAEVFTESGVARINGNPKILEIVANESGSITVQKVSDIAGKSWPTDLEKDANLPNLSLNKGIRRRAPFWFHLAALFGTGLQLAVVLYAALTVLYWPEAFLKDGSRVDGYALPLYVIGTALLTLGMFFCAFLVERFSMKHTFRLPQESRVYWIQPGNQEVGDQIFPSFVGQTEKGIEFTRSVRHHSSDDVLNARKTMELVAIVGLTMVGFVLQFVGLRGLHSSVILANLGSTMVMTFVRTCLRAQRMHEGDNMLKDDQGVVCRGEHELDWLVFHLFKLRSFKIRTVSTLPTQRPQTQPKSVALDSLTIRSDLTKLTGSHWNETPARKLAYKLGQATHDLVKLISSWSDKEVPYFDIVIPLEVEKDGSSQSISHDWEIHLSARASIDVEFLEAMIGLYVWSLRQANHDLRKEYQDKFFRAFEPKDKNAHQAGLIYQKWTNDKSALVDQNQTSSINFLGGCQTFGHFQFGSSSPRTGDAALVAVSSDLYTLAAQDIYIHILRSLIGRLPEIGGTTQIMTSDDTSYKVNNDRLEKLSQVFIQAGLGRQQEGMVCTIPVLSDLKLLPEITFDSLDVSQRIHELERNGDYSGILAISQWLCSFADYGEIERALVEYGFVCLMGLMIQDAEAKELAVKRIKAIATDFHKTHTKAFGDIASLPQSNWRASFRNAISWIALRLMQYQAVYNPDKQNLRISQEFEKELGWVLLMHGTSSEPESAASCEIGFFSMWFDARAGNMPDESDTYKVVLDWLVKDQHEIMLEILIMRLAKNWSPRFSEEHLAKMFSYVVQKNYSQTVYFLSHHTEKVHLKDLIIQELAMSGDLKALQVLLDLNNSGTITRAHELSVSIAAEHKQFPVLDFLLQKGVDVDAQDESGETGLMKAVKNNDIGSVRLFLSHKANLEKPDKDGQTALMLAAGNGCLDIAKLLVSEGANVNATAHDGSTALMEASRIQNLPLLKYLCEQKADIHAIDLYHRSALDKATYGGLEEAWEEGCQYLAGLGAKNYQGSQYPEL